MAVKGARLKDIRTVHSHIHALGQCRKIIRKHGWKARGRGRHRRRGAPDRRGAATRRRRRWRRGSPPSSTGSTSSSRTSRTRPTTPPASSSSPRTRPCAKAGNGKVITTFVFRVRNVPAALYKAMGGFATNGVNMTKLEVLPARRPVLRHPVLRRRRGPPGRPAAQAGAGGARLLLDRGARFSASIRRVTGARVGRNRIVYPFRLTALSPIQ